MLRRWIALWLVWMVCAGCACAAPLETDVPLELTSPAAMLVEAETGTVIFEKGADERRQVASVTKLMTLLICLEKLEAGEISLQDQVTISPEAAGQIGSQALLDAHASYPLETLLHATIIASANDAACALAEHMAGTETTFADLMNARAQELGMENTFYTNSTGLPDNAQYTTARDVAVLACEVCRHPLYFEHASVWMDTLIHPSGRTTDLTNTNRLVRFYDGCDGLKTGSADVSKYCLVSTAQKNGLRLIAVVLGTPVSQTRFDEARAMMDYGFASYKRVTLLQTGDRLGKTVRVRMGMQDELEAAAGNGVSMLIRPGQEKQLSMEVELPEEVNAPVKQGDTLGVVRVLMNGEIIAKLPAVASEDVGMPGLLEGFVRLFANWR